MTALAIHNAWVRLSWLHDSAEQQAKDYRNAQIMTHWPQEKRMEQACAIMAVIERETGSRIGRIRRAQERLKARLGTIVI